MGTKVPKTTAQIIYVLLMISTVVVIDIAFFKNHTAERLAANIGVILLYVAFYYRYFKRN